jgi:DNA-binding GntR family transcriptional regulator
MSASRHVQEPTERFSRSRRALSAADRAYEHVRHQILTGELKSGSILSEAELGAEIGMSRTPVRQGLQLLLEEGLVDVGPRRQLVVKAISPERTHEVFMLRDALERVAVTQACKVMALDDVDYFRLILIRQRRAAKDGDVARFMDLDEEFHLTLANGSQLLLLGKFLNQLRALIRFMGTEAVRNEGRMEAVITEHEQIVDAIERRDTKAAVGAMSAHLGITERLLLK